MDITLKGVTKAFGEKTVFSNFNCKIRDNEMIAIMGESGKGKTTLLNIIGLIEKPDSGTITYGKESSIKGVNATKFRRYELGYLFQNYALIDDLTVEQNLRLSLAYSTSKNKTNAIQEALSTVSLHKNFLKQKVFSLSGGEQQRVAVARLLLKPCSLILADEPTGSLDEDNKNLIIQLLLQINKNGKTIMIATHDKTIADVCTRTIRI